jgi:hypothetical protein
MTTWQRLSIWEKELPHETTDIQTFFASAKIRKGSACVAITKMRWRLSIRDVCKPDETKQYDNS